MNNGIDKITDYKSQMVRLLCDSREIRRLMSNDTYPDITTQQLLDHYILPWEFVPDTTTEEGVFLCCEVDMQGVESPVIATFTLQFYIICHRNLLRMPGGETGSRVDLLTQEVNRLFNGSNELGLSPVGITPFSHYIPAPNFYGRHLAFTVKDFNRFGEAP